MNGENIPIVIDGPNYINRILDMSIDKDIISNQLSFSNFRETLKMKLLKEGICAQLNRIEFVCSKKLFGLKTNKFNQNERDLLLERLSLEVGVHVEEINIPGSGSQEKGVDNMIATKIESFSENHNYIILISNDQDFVPLLTKMREKGKKIILVSISQSIPKHLINESYMVINLYDEYECLFCYKYPHYPLYRDFSLEKYREIISNADDRINNQIRVTDTGFIYMSYKDIGFQNILGIKFRSHTFGARNDYVGPKAASDSTYIENNYKQLMLAWKNKVSFDFYYS
jgi:uncharacterized LabA/DUF88 family protein